MLQSPAHGLKVLTAELTDDVRRASLGSFIGSAIDPWSHTLDFVLDQGLPVLAVNVAPPAIEVSWIVKLMPLHFLFCVKGLEAAFDVAWYCLDGLERDHHLLGLSVVISSQVV